MISILYLDRIKKYIILLKSYNFRNVQGKAPGFSAGDPADFFKVRELRTYAFQRAGACGEIQVKNGPKLVS